MFLYIITFFFRSRVHVWRVGVNTALLSVCNSIVLSIFNIYGRSNLWFRGWSVFGVLSGLTVILIDTHLTVFATRMHGGRRGLICKLLTNSPGMSSLGSGTSDLFLRILL